jgi:8-oxo-dGTP diphosphatase
VTVLRSAAVTGNNDLRATARPGELDGGSGTDRYRSIVDVYVLLRRPDGMILLLERAGTGYADGQLCPPSGHLEAGESVVQGVIREAREEVGVRIDPADLAFSHVIHHRNPLGQARIGFFFSTTRWRGEPVNTEPHKCAGLYWVDPARPPVNTVPYTAAALAAITRGASFSLDGWRGW